MRRLDGRSRSIYPKFCGQDLHEGFMATPTTELAFSSTHACARTTLLLLRLQGCSPSQSLSVTVSL
jgi:hypothetical protein